jgi:phosphopantothenoylcysteine decarboxylase/phosphopantothenate--cysteine ligase
MYQVATRIFPNTDAAILCAAVADFTPANVADNKIKREGNKLILELEPTKDIAKALGQMKKQGQVMVGFALETNDEENHAKEKLQKKNLDFIVLNSLQDEGAGFQHNTNKVTLIDKDSMTCFPLKSKKEVAKDIVNKLVSIIK